MTEASGIRKDASDTGTEEPATLDYSTRTELGRLAIATRRDYLAAGAVS